MGAERFFVDASLASPSDTLGKPSYGLFGTCGSLAPQAMVNSLKFIG